MSSIVSPVTFHHPRFDNSIKDKIGVGLQVDSEHSLSQISETAYKGKHAIASFGVESNVDGIHVFVTRIDIRGEAFIRIGWTGSATSDSHSFDCPGVQGGGMSGFALNLCSGGIIGRDRGFCGSSHSSNITKQSKEVVSILQISGRKRIAQFVVDGHEGKVHDATKCFDNKNKCFPLIILNTKPGAKVTTIPFSELKSTSPIIEEFKKQRDSHPPPQLLPPSSTNNEENEKLIAELRRQVEEGNRRLLEQKDEQIEEMKIMFETKERQMKEQLQVKDRQLSEMTALVEAKDQQLSQNLNSNERMLQRCADEKKQIEKQLELERAEHQKTRNLLHQKTTEMKDMEIHFLKEQNKLLQKESGQRRERENADEFQVKKERED